MVAMVTKDKSAWIPLFFAFYSHKTPFAIVYMHVETVKAGMDLGSIQETNSAL